MLSSKIIPFESAADFFAEIRARGKKIVQCHGVFDLFHPGHIHFFTEARRKGDILVITVVSEKHVTKGPGRPYFDDYMRSNALASLADVDYVVISPTPKASEALDCVRPHIYCKGMDGGKGASDEIFSADEKQVIEKLGSQTCILNTNFRSSTKLINRHFDHLSKPVKNFCSNLASDFSTSDFKDALELFAGLKILVIGDTICDRYSYLKVQGLTSKNRIISGRFLREETQGGGALAVFRHVRQFASKVKFISLVGTEPWIDEVLKSELEADQDLVFREESFHTVVKERYVEPFDEGKELSKLFSVNYIDPEPTSDSIQEKFLARTAKEIKKVDLVLLLDFGHGLLGPKLRELIQSAAPFLSINCQTNSNNHGFNIISRKYQGCNSFSLDELELMLSCGRREISFPDELNVLRRRLGAKYAWLTRGSIETIGQEEGQDMCHCPPLEVDVVDTIGAGDAFFSLASMAAARDIPIPLATFIGQLAGAQAVKIVGNTHPISKEILLQSGMSLLEF
jgi:cytidyltransferase-like protein